MILSGISGYAHKQAAMCTRMAEQGALSWLPHLKSQGGGILPSWGLKYKHLLVEAQASVYEACDDESSELDDLDSNEMEGEEELEVGEDQYFELDDI